MTERILNDRYALESKVGEGGMAVTYRARDLLLNRTVAVKLMREQFTTDQQFVERFRREAQAAAQISHENIASVYDTGRSNGTYYIVMEYVEGTDLKQRLRREGALPVLTALEIGRQIAAALDAAHRGGLVHRDIKPHNILLNQDGKVKVTDFGIAKMTSDGEDTGVIIGSVHYVSPEQARGEATTPSSDLYSLGAVLFELLTGRTVFEADNAMAVAHKQIYERPPLPRTLRPEIPPAVESMVLRCLEKDARARYQSAAELQAVIAQLTNQLAQEATIIITPPAPSMDATMVFQTPVDAPTVKDAYRARPADGYAETAPRGGSGKGGLIGMIFIVLAVVVGFGAYKLIGGVTPPPPAPGNITPGQAVIVPSLIGTTREAAIVTLKGLGLASEIKSDFSDQVPEGLVLRQEPSGGTSMQTDAEVTIWVSKGPAQFTMPDVLMRMDIEAKNSIRLAGYGKTRDFVTKYQESPHPKGMVLSTDPPADTVVKYGKKVTLILSKGPGEEKKLVTETYHSTVPNIGGTDRVYYRVEIIRPSGQPEEMASDSGMPGDPINVESFSRGVDEQVTVRMLAGKDADSLVTVEELKFGPGTKPTSQPGV